MVDLLVSFAFGVSCLASSVVKKSTLGFSMISASTGRDKVPDPVRLRRKDVLGEGDTEAEI